MTMRRQARAVVPRATAVACAVARSLWALLIDEETKRLDVSQLLLVLGLGLLAYGAGLVYPPARFIVPGVVILWLVLPTRPPFLHRPKGGSS